MKEIPELNRALQIVMLDSGSLSRLALELRGSDFAHGEESLRKLVDEMGKMSRLLMRVTNALIEAHCVIREDLS
jgi:hypothetical protein